MENIQLLMHGFPMLSTSSNVGAALLGAALDFVVGAIPGVGSLAGMALLLLLTYKFNPTTAIIMLGALYHLNMYDGVFSAILLGIPGDSPTVCTAMGGYPMASKKKHPGQVLSTANMASFIGGTTGIIVLTFTGPALADIGPKFDPFEVTALLLTAMTSISWLVRENSIKGVVITILDILLANIGMDTLSGSPKYDFSNMHLLGGTPFTPLIIGTVGFSQAIEPVVERGNEVKLEPHVKLTICGSLLTKHDFERLLPPALRSGVMRTFMGVLPGAGATTNASMGYAAQKKFKNEEELGTGIIEGIAVSEVANNAVATGAFTPLLTLGASGGDTGAVLLGGPTMWGPNPGPLLLTNESELTWGLIASLFLSNILALIMTIGVIPFLIQIPSVLVKYMTLIITTACVVESYSSSYSMYSVLIMFLSGILGYLLVKNDYPTTPTLLFSVFARLLRSNMQKASIISGGSLSIFFTRPIICVLMLIFLAFICTPIIKTILEKAGENKIIKITYRFVHTFMNID